MTNSHEFGAWLRNLRASRDLTQEALAELVGCAAETVRSFESGRRRPSRAMATRLADVLQIEASQRDNFITLARATAATTPVATVAEPPITPALLRPRLHYAVHLPPDALIGRQAELAQLQRAVLNERRRLITVLGPGGIGKTRLALQLTADLAPEFAQQVVFVPLAPVASVSHAIIAIAEAIGCILPAALPSAEALIDVLRNQRLLLTLDTVEHLLAAEHGDQLGALLGAIVREAPDVQIVVTSRERLKLRAEWITEIQALSLPNSETITAIDRSEAVLLFLDRARQVTGNFSLTAANRQAVARICRLLDGMPLAIELAAAWVRMLTCDEIAAEIVRDSDFLAATDRELPDRHRSLRAVIEHSWQLLTPAEQTLLMRLALFRGGCRREAIVAVAASDGSSVSILALLASLIDKSLVRRVIDSDGMTRYTLHDLVRQYAYDWLEASPLNADTRARHAAYYAGWIADHDHALKSEQQKATIRAMTTEIENIRDTWQYACEHREAGWLRQMLPTLDWFYELRGWYAEAANMFQAGHHALHDAAIAPDASAEVQSAYWLMYGREGWHIFRHNPAQALQQLQESVDQLRAVSPTNDHIHCLKGLAYLNIFAGHYAKAKAYLDEATILAEQLNSIWQRSVIAVVRGVLEVFNTEPIRVRDYLHDALAMARLSGDPRPIAMTLSYLGLTALALGELNEAEQSCGECLVLAAESQDRFQMSLALQSLGRVALARQDIPAGAWLFDEGLSLAREIHDRWLEAQGLGYLGLLALEQGNRQLAGKRFREAVQVSAAAPIPFALDALARLAEFTLDEQPEAALLALAYVLQHPLTRPQTRAAAEAAWQSVGQLAAQVQAKQQVPTIAGERPATLLRLFATS